MDGRRNRMIAPGIVTCRKCGAYIGHYVERRVQHNGHERWETWLAIGGAVVRYAGGVCMACGSEWYWSSSRKRMDRLIDLTNCVSQ